MKTDLFCICNLTLKRRGRSSMRQMKTWSRCCRVGIFTVATIMLCLVSTGFAESFPGGYRTITQLFPYDDGGRTPYISGIQFDDQSDPWVLDGLSWEMKRLDKENGGVLETYTPTPDTAYNDSLAWNSLQDNFYTVNRSALFCIDLSSDTRIRTSLYGLQSFNFLDLAFDPTGKLWLATDQNGGELWSIDTTNSTLTFENDITLELNQKIRSLAIDKNGQFLIATSSPYGENRISQLDPITGEATMMTSWNDLGSFIADMDIDQTTGRCFGIREARLENPRGFYFVELLGVPEPSSTTLLIAAVVCLLAMRKKVKQTQT